MTPSPASHPRDDRPPYTLVCDFGSLHTKATLFGEAAGCPRLLATVATPTPRNEDTGAPSVREAAAAARERLGALTGIPLSPEGSDEDVMLLAAGSCAAPLEVLLVAGDKGAARRAAEYLDGATYARPARAGSVAELLAPDALPEGYRPDVVILAEGRAGLPRSQAQPLAQLLVRVGADTRLLSVLHCRPEREEADAGASAVLGRLDTETIPADLTAKASETASLVRRWLDLLYAERGLSRSGGALLLPLQPGAGFLSSAGALGITARYAAGSGSVLAVDVGASSVTACLASEEGFSSVVLSGPGIGAGIVPLLARVGEDSVRRWLPFEPRGDEVWEWALLRGTLPGTLPLSRREALIEQAFVREAMRLAVQQLPLTAPPRLVVGGGALARAMATPIAAVLMLDVLTLTRPDWQRVDLAVDTGNVLVAVGALAAAYPELAAKVWERDAPRTVATALAARGARPGAVAAAATLRWQGGSREMEVPAGTLQHLRPPHGEGAELAITPSRGVRLEGADRNQPAVLEIAPSALSPLPQVLLDTRPHSVRGERRAAAVAGYLLSSGAYAARELEDV